MEQCINLPMKQCFITENIEVITINNQIFHLHIYKKRKNTDEIM